MLCMQDHRYIYGSVSPVTWCTGGNLWCIFPYYFLLLSFSFKTAKKLILWSVQTKLAALFRMFQTCFSATSWSISTISFLIVLRILCRIQIKYSHRSNCNQKILFYWHHLGVLQAWACVLKMKR